MPDIGSVVASSQAGWVAFVTLLLTVTAGTWRAFAGEKRKVVLASYHEEVCGYHEQRAIRAEAERDKAMASLSDSTRVLAEATIELRKLRLAVDGNGKRDQEAGP